MSALPRSSPWGAVQKCEELADGVFQVSTASHGGIMVRYAASEFLSAEALKCGFRGNRSFCFEEDCCAQVAIRELLDKNLWRIPGRITDKGKYEDSINESLKRWQPEYWDARQASIAAQTDKKPATLAERLEAGKAKAAAHNAARQTPGTPQTKKDATEH